MTRGKPLSEDIRNAIVAAYNKNYSGRKIAKMLSLPQGTVRNIITQHKHTGSVSVKLKTGRISKITTRDQRVLQRLLKKDRRMPSRQLAVEWGDAIGKRVSKDTCLRNIKKLGYGFYKVC